MLKEMIFLTSMLTCAPTEVVNTLNNTDKIETESDLRVLYRAKKRCKELYGGSPCVKKFIIKTDDFGDRSWSVVCYQEDRMRIEEQR